MKFESAGMLFLLWLVPFVFGVCLFGMRRRRSILSRFSSPRGLGVAVPEISNARRWIKAVLVMTAAIFLTIALAGPQYGFHWETVEQRGVDIIIALDCSRSMLAEDIVPSRLDRAKREIYDLLGMLQGDRVGLVAFAGTAFLQCPLTLDYDAFHIFLSSLSPDFLPRGGTDVPAALSQAMAGFPPEGDADRAVILITDGENTGSGDPLESAEAARDGGVKIFCIGIGGDEGAPIPDATGGFRKDGAGNIVLSRLDETTLKGIALKTGGTYVRSVAGDMDLEAIYSREIRKEMTATTQESGRKKVWENRFQWFLAVAILMLLIEVALPEIGRGAILFIALVLSCSYQPAAWAGTAGKVLRGGSEAYERGEYQEALKSFVDAQLEDPDRPEIYYDIGNAHYRLGDFDAAEENYRAALKDGGDGLRHKARYNLGNTSYRKGKLEEAITHYEEALKIDPRDEEARQNLEFVKKKLEEQKRQAQEEKQERKKDEQTEARDEQAGDGETGEAEPGKGQGNGQKGNDESSSDEESPSPRYGEEMDDAGQGDEGGSPDVLSGDHDRAQPSVRPGEEPAGDEARHTQAERILNRLQDQPGRAMVPRYEKGAVEKDW